MSCFVSVSLLTCMTSTLNHSIFALTPDGFDMMWLIIPVVLWFCKKQCEVYQKCPQGAFLKCHLAYLLISNSTDVGLDQWQNVTFISIFVSDTWISQSCFPSPQYQGARDPGDEQASSESEEEEAHLRARGQQTTSVAGWRGSRTKGQM